MGKRLLLLFMVLVSAGAGSATAQKYYTPDFEAIISKYGCAGCHGGSGGMNVTPYASLMTTGTHAPVVVARDSNSYLVRKLKGAAGVGSRMPLGGPYLTAGEIQTVVQWIMEGAKEAAVVAVGDGTGTPLRFELSQNYPNPFNPTTAVSFQLPVASQVELGVFDELGRDVATLVHQSMDAGVHNVVFDASSLPSGVYLYRLQAGSFVETKKLVVLR